MMVDRAMSWLAILGITLGGTNPLLRAETVYVDCTQGSDANRGTADKPVRSLARAAEIVNRTTDPGPTTVKIAPAGKHGHHTDQIEVFGPILLRFLNRVHAVR